MQHLQVLADTCFLFLCLNLMVMKSDIWFQSWDFPLNYVRFSYIPSSVIFRWTQLSDTILFTVPGLSHTLIKWNILKIKNTTECKFWINHLTFKHSKKSQKTKTFQMSYRCYYIILKNKKCGNFLDFLYYLIPGASIFYYITHRQGD